MSKFEFRKYATAELVGSFKDDAEGGKVGISDKFIVVRNMKRTTIWIYENVGSYK